MSIPNVLSNISFLPPVTPEQPSAAQLAAQQIITGIGNLYVYNIQERIRLYNIFWNNENSNCTADLIGEAMGTLLVSCFEADIALVTFLETMANSTTPSITIPPAAIAGLPPGWSFTPNNANDGSGTIIQSL